MNTPQEIWAQRVASIQASAAAFGMRAEAGYDDQRRVLLARQEHLVARSQRILDAADAAGRELSADERRGIQQRTAEVERIDDELQALEVEFSQPQARRTPANSAEPLQLNGNSNRIETGASRINTVAPLTGGRTFAAMFPQARGGDRQFASLGDFARAVYERNPRLFNAASGMGEGVGADGGFFVPVGFYAGLMDGSLQQEAIRPYATIIPMTSAQMTIPMFDLSNRSTGIATMEGKVTGEGVTGTTQKAKVREVNLIAKKISILVPSSIELMQDAPQLFGGLLQTAMQEALAQTLDTWFISSGTGVGSPMAILNAPCTVSQAKDSGQTAATITPTNIANMVSRLAPGSWSKAIWLCSPSALAALFTLKTIVQNVALSENVGGFAPEFFNVLPDGKFSLCGRPLIVSDRCAALGTVGDIMLCDLSQYILGIRQNAELAVDASVGFKESEVWFRLNCRVDGMPAQASAITPRVGSTTLSPFVTLATRS